MGRYITKQPNGKYTVFCTVSDTPIYWNITKEEYFDIRLNEIEKQLAKTINEMFEENQLEDFYSMISSIDIGNMTIKGLENYCKDVGYEEII